MKIAWVALLGLLLSAGASAARADTLDISAADSQLGLATSPQNTEAFSTSFNFDPATNAVSNLVYQSSGYLGTFIFAGTTTDFCPTCATFFFNWTNATGDIIQLYDEFAAPGDGQVPLTPNSTLFLELNGRIYGAATITDSAVETPEPGELTLVMIGLAAVMVALAGRRKAVIGT
jgi:hypothetical protein